MGLSGIQIFKLLPKTNCGDCGVPTCLAFAMNLAASKAELSACPHVSEEAKAQLASGSAPPIRTVTFGAGERAVTVGGETVLFRHEKTFFNKTGLAVQIADTESADSVKGKLERLMKLSYVRVGLNLHAEAAALKCASGDPAKFAELAKAVKEYSQAAPILIGSPKEIEAAAPALKDRKPLLYAATTDTVDAMAALAKANGCPLAVKGKTLDEVAALTQKLAGQGLNDLVIDPGSRAIKQALFDEVAIRRLAIQKTFRPLGYPTITFPCEMTGDFMMETVYASLLMAKYAGVMVLSDLRGENLFPLLLERLNIYTDPQRPMKTTEGVYEINKPNENSPVLITSNFSLTYFIVSGEIESSRVPTWLLVLDTDGLSVLTAWAAGKFVGETVGSLVKKTQITQKLNKKNLILPGAVAVLLGDVEEEVGKDWNVLVGPRESAHIPAFLRQNFAA
ncbi:MAG: acetyl-CoA decarbonylase/synthase complex subunit gamma [Myxococcales bacterium]|nr:MAG: acetyl-CoA decarbonylase/synthase complex subunit gamma [Myxococcales bacterium]